MILIHAIHSLFILNARPIRHNSDGPLKSCPFHLGICACTVVLGCWPRGRGGRLHDDAPAGLVAAAAVAGLAASGVHGLGLDDGRDGGGGGALHGDG